MSVDFSKILWCHVPISQPSAAEMRDYFAYWRQIQSGMKIAIEVWQRHALRYLLRKPRASKGWRRHVRRQKAEARR